MYAHSLPLLHLPARVAHAAAPDPDPQPRPAGIWFVKSQFGFLDVSVGGQPLQALCFQALAALLPALLVPGLIHAKAHRPAVGALLLVQVGRGGQRGLDGGGGGGAWVCVRVCEGV